MTTDPASSRLSQLRVALMTLTRLPVGQVADPVPSMASARWAYPHVGLIVGGLVGGVFVGSGVFGIPVVLSAFLAVLTGMFVTGALHEDGLADCADGFWGGRDRARKLDIMRDSRIGTYGTLALIFAVVLKGVAFASVPSAFWSIVGVAVLSRFAMGAAIEWMPPAQGDGLGASVADGESQLGLAATGGAVGLLALWLAVGAGTFVVLAVMGLAGLWLARLAKRHIGGQTGDVLGCMQQVTEVAGLIALAALSN